MASVSLTASGIDFSDYQTNVGGMTSELMDHYEEGTWTPTYSGGSITGTSAIYTKIGGLVQFQNAISWNTGNGSNQFAGLPFTAFSGHYSMTIVPYADSGIPAPPSGKGWVIGYVLQNGTTMQFFWEPTTTSVSMASSGALYFEGSYRAA